MNTPWGMSDASEKILPGVQLVETPGHGGYMVTKRKGDTFLSPEAKMIAQSWSYFPTHYCFEEDCNWPLLLWENKQIRDEVRRRHAFWNESDRYKDDVAYCQYLRECLHTFHKAYLVLHPKAKGA